MNLKLTDKTALVSGSPKGIGLAIARQLVSEGAHVVVNALAAATNGAALRVDGGVVRACF